MAQLRDDYSDFLNRDSDLVVIGAEGAEKFINYWRENILPFTAVPDPRRKVLNLYGQQVKIFKFGRMPAQVIIDKSGTIRYLHYGLSMSDIPDIKALLTLFDKINTEAENLATESHPR